MLISVIIPVYNVELYLSRCVESVLGQSFADLELILIDDGSTDGSAAICDEYAQSDERVRVLHKPNGGVSSARNAGIAITKGEYMCFVDSDDWLELDYFAAVAEILREKKPALLLNQYLRNDGTGNEYNKFAAFPMMTWTRWQAVYEIIANRYVAWGPFASFYEATGLHAQFPEDICYGEDLWFKYRFIKEAKGCIIFQPIAKYHYYLREGSACTGYHVAKKIDDLKVIEEIMRCEDGKLGKMLFAKEYIPRLVSYSTIAVRSADAMDAPVRADLLRKVQHNLRRAFLAGGISAKLKLKLAICACPGVVLKAAHALYRCVHVKHKQ